MRPLLLASIVTLAATSIASAQIQLGPVFQADAETPGDQRLPSAAADAEGNFVVIWQSEGQDGSAWGIFGRRFDASSTPRGPEFQANTYTTGDQGGRLDNSPAVVSDGFGNYTVVWGNEWNRRDTDVLGQRYNASGNRVGSEFQVNSATIGEQYHPSLASDANGNVVVVWRSPMLDAGELWGQRYDPAGLPVGGEFSIDVERALLHMAPSVAAHDGGGFVVAWKGIEPVNGDPHHQDGIYLRSYDASGVSGDEIQANSCWYPFDQKKKHAVASLGGGSFVVAWFRSDQSNSNTWLEAQVFGPDGFPVGREIAVANASPYYDGLSLVADGPDRFTVLWVQPNVGLVGRSFNSAGVPTSARFLVVFDIESSGISAALQGPGKLVVVWEGAVQYQPWLKGIYGRLISGLGSELEQRDLGLDPTGNRVLENGEIAALVPGWRNPTATPIAASGALTGFTGPGGATYTIVDGAAEYGVIAPGQRGDCAAAADCYSLSVSASSRPTQHWDAAVEETLSTGTIRTWPIHIGESFTDVPRTRQDYAFVEALLHHGITAGCATGLYCPDNPISRGEMAVYLRAAREGGEACPPLSCDGTFADVPNTNPFCRWIEELSRLRVVAGCGGGNYCPDASVTREQMAVLVLVTREGAAYAPPECVAGAETFTDVPASSPYCRWIEELARRNVVTGCGGGLYCPTASVTRGDMSVFVSVTFGLPLYGP